MKLDPYYSSWAVKRAVARFVEDCNHRRYHESLQNVTPADMYHGRQAAILARRRSDQATDAAATEAGEFTDAASRGHSLRSLSQQKP